VTLRIYADCETTGLCAGDHLIASVAGVLKDSERTVSHFYSLANPGEEHLQRDDIDEAFAINGLTREMLRAAPPTEEVAKQFGEWLLSCTAAGWQIGDLHAYNRGFDSRFLAEMPWNVPDAWWGECVMLAAHRVINPYGRWPKLVAAARHFGLEWEGKAHGALPDALMAARVHQKILERRVAAV
jgi:DNA polymerase III epsilon subunit-like protein